MRGGGQIEGTLDMQETHQPNTKPQHLRLRAKAVAVRSYENVAIQTANGA